MSKFFRNILLFLLTAVMMLSGTVTAFAEDGIENPYIENIRGASIMGTSPVIFRDTSTGMPAYCIDYNRGIPDPQSLSGEFDPMTIFDPATYQGLEYLLLAGYPFETGGLSNEEAQACTQLAVWCWTYETLGYGLNANNYSATSGREDVYNYFIGLMEAARNQTPPDIGIDSTDVDMAIDDNTLTGETTITVRNLATGYVIDESVLPDGITVSGYTGNDGDVLIFTATLDYADESLTIENLFTGQDTRSALNLFWYDNSNPNQQRMVISYLDETTIAVASGIALRFEALPEPTEGKIKLIKKDKDNHNYLAGAVFGVYRVSDDVKVYEMETGENGTAVSPLLPASDYYLKELRSPENYQLSTEKYGVTVKADETVKITITNTKIPVTPDPTEGRIKLIKKDKANGNLLGGAIFGVYRASDDVKVCEMETMSNGEAVSPLLPAADYYLKELRSPDNYQLSTDKYGVKVKVNETVEITITNTKTPTPEPTPAPTPSPTPTPKPSDPTGTLLLLKKAEQTGAPLADAVFGIYRVSDDAKVGELKTTADGKAAIKLPMGDFYLKELKAPHGFLLEKAKIYFTVVKDSTVTVEVTNQRDKTVIEPIEIPKTGEVLPYGNYILASLCLSVAGICGAMLYLGRKKKCITN